MRHVQGFICHHWYGMVWVSPSQKAKSSLCEVKNLLVLTYQIKKLILLLLVKRSITQNKLKWQPCYFIFKTIFIIGMWIRSKLGMRGFFIIFLFFRLSMSSTWFKLCSFSSSSWGIWSWCHSTLSQLLWGIAITVALLYTFFYWKRLPYPDITACGVI